MPLRVDHERLDDPEQTRGEIPRARRPADAEARARALGAAHQQKQQRHGEKSATGNESGGCASAITAPAKNANATLRQPRAAASRAGTDVMAPDLFRRLRGRPGRAKAHAHPLDAPRVGVDHLELDGRRDA